MAKGKSHSHELQHLQPRHDDLGIVPELPILASSTTMRELAAEINATKRAHERFHYGGFSSSPGSMSPERYHFSYEHNNNGPRKSFSVSELRSGLAVPVTVDVPQKPSYDMTVVRAGSVQKLFLLPTALLVEKVPFFAQLAIKTTKGAPRLTGPFYFPQLDEFAFAMFLQWLTDGTLTGPHDFHSLNHYLCLYVLALKFDIEELKNQTMDLVREYYRRENMTAPAFRLDYIYQYTEGPNQMRDFLVASAAYRVLLEPDKDMSESIKTALRQGNDLAVDFASALVWIVRNDMQDARRGDPCKWHEHVRTHKCAKWRGPEPYEQD